MLVANLQLPLAAIFTPLVVRWTVWVGLVGLTVALLALMRTRWGQNHPLRKCIVLSLVAHLLVGIYATTVNIVTGGGGAPGNRSVTVALLDGADGPDDIDAPGPQKAWDRVSDGAADPVDMAHESQVAPPPPEPEPLNTTRLQEPDAPAPREIIEPSLPDRKPEPPIAPTLPDEPLTARKVDKSVEPIDVPPPPTDDEPNDVSSEPDGPNSPEGTKPSEAVDAPIESSTDSGPLKAIKPLPDTSGESSNNGATGSRPKIESSRPGAADGSANGTAADDVPSAYKERFAPNHARVAQQHGGSKQTEAAVVAALKWLAANQSRDGRWNARSLEAGREVKINGHDRRGAGSQADTGVTGLALLAFLASGHTHERGDHQDTVRRGMEFLMNSQAADGNLGGDATLYEKMYCHAMATFAMSEDYAMSGDKRLESAVRRAVTYTVNCQHMPSGGWRYQPGEAGDTSQLGWQVMALKSAELAKIHVPERTRDGMIRFLKSVAGGEHAGLASYRPGHQNTRAMTAEALVCRLFLGMDRANPAANEAGNYLLGEVPGEGETNLYYWYYATLGMYQLQGEHWRRWNEALQPALVGTQRTEGRLAGSWDPDAVWGAYGGRVYSTALSTLCLEVYYRYLPLQVDAASRDNRAK